MQQEASLRHWLPSHCPGCGEPLRLFPFDLGTGLEFPVCWKCDPDRFREILALIQEADERRGPVKVTTARL